MLTNHLTTIKLNGDLHQPGVDFGPKQPKLLHANKLYAVIKQCGHTGWASRGSQCYYPTEYYLVETKDWSGRSFRVARIIEKVEPGRKYRDTIKDLKAKCDQLADQQKIPDSQGVTESASDVLDTQRRRMVSWGETRPLRKTREIISWLNSYERTLVAHGESECEDFWTEANAERWRQVEAKAKAVAKMIDAELAAKESD